MEKEREENALMISSYGFDPLENIVEEVVGVVIAWGGSIDVKIRVDMIMDSEVSSW